MSASEKLLVRQDLAILEFLERLIKEAEKVAFKFMDWAAELRREGRKGLSSATFVRRKLRVLKLGELMCTISRGGRTYQLPAVVNDG